MSDAVVVHPARGGFVLPVMGFRTDWPQFTFEESEAWPTHRWVLADTNIDSWIAGFWEVSSHGIVIIRSTYDEKYHQSEVNRWVEIPAPIGRNPRGAR
jgi:hypothetical protein